MFRPARGDVWFADLKPARGHEQDGDRPVLVLSVDALNDGPAGLFVGVPVTRKDKGIASHIRIDPPLGGMKEPSFIMCEQLRCLSKDRLRRLSGSVDPKTMAEVEYAVSVVLGLP